MNLTKKHKIKDITGRDFGYLTVINYERLNKANRAMWKCICKCGKEAIISGTNLRTGVTRSCGCLAKEYPPGLKHGGRFSPEYSSYNGMKIRCYSEGSKDYKSYGAREITVCDRWLYGENGKHGFECFIEDMGEKTSKSHSIDRINNGGPYSPENCRWATAKEQMRNRRNNTLVIVEGKETVLSEACEKYNIGVATVNARLKKGWGTDKSFLTPVRKKMR